MLITPKYKALLQQQHETCLGWGTGAGSGNPLFNKMALQLIKEMRPKTVLDYGAGKRALEGIFPGIRSYDPGVPGIDNPPQPADLVLCCCVLEHIEPDCLDHVLDHMRLMTLNRILIMVSCFPGTTLPDGRNAHLIIEDIDWWLPKLLQRWRITSASKTYGPRFWFNGRA